METGANKLAPLCQRRSSAFAAAFLPKLIRFEKFLCFSGNGCAHTPLALQTGLSFVKARRACLLEAPPSFAVNRKRNLTCVAPRNPKAWSERERKGGVWRKRRQRGGRSELLFGRISRELCLEPGYYRVRYLRNYLLCIIYVLHRPAGDLTTRFHVKLRRNQLTRLSCDDT